MLPNPASDARATSGPIGPIAPTLSRYAAQAIAADPTLAAVLTAHPVPDAARLVARLGVLVAGAADAAGLARGLRRLRREVYLEAMEADLQQRWTLTEVTGTMTLLAEVALQACCDLHHAALVAEHGAPCNDAGVEQPFAVIGMGKLGGRELNVSSDIDLIFAYDSAGETTGRAGASQGRLSNAEFFAKLGKRIIAAMSAIDADGFVFRVDMRLRPNGDSGALVSSLASLETYFVVQGREWERYAWLKARVVASVAPDAASRDAFIIDLEALRRPFVFRRYLDYGAIGALRDLHHQIRDAALRRAALHPRRALDVKLGRGGIREVEFIAQVFQLIHGGRIAVLQTRSLHEALDLLATRGLLERHVTDELERHYGFLRGLEHRLQYLDDSQTHSVPLDDDDRRRVAAMAGFPDAASMLAALADVQSDVAQVFDHIFDTQPRDPAATDTDWLIGSMLADEGGVEAARDILAARGLLATDEIARRFAALARSRRVRELPESSRKRLETLVEPILGVIARLDTIELQAAAAARFADLIETIAPRSTYLALLCEYPSALERIGRLLMASAWAASWLIKHPILLDELLDRRNSEDVIDWQVVRSELDHTLDACRLADGRADLERQLDVMRETHHLWSFRLLVRDLDGRLSVEALGDELSALADLIVGATLALAWRELDRRHRDDHRFVVIAYGKLGSKELGYASDLDLVFVYDDADPAAAEVYARLARRLVIWLTSTTAAGALFEVDLRLRPNGDAGLPVISYAGFERYQLRDASNAAWVWEHQALTRARFCAGHAETGARIEALRLDVLRQSRDRTELFDEIRAMRKRMHDGHVNPTIKSEHPMFDLKHDAGGMVDIEFIVQALVLDCSHAHPDLAEDVGNIALLHRAAGHGLLPAELADGCADAYRLYRARQHAVRLATESTAGSARVDIAEFVAQRALVSATWSHLFG
jgi:glutamate-ammonia-ligase adenylyltransferase